MFEVEFLKYATMEYRFVARKTKQWVWKGKKEPEKGREEGKPLSKSITMSCPTF